MRRLWSTDELSENVKMISNVRPTDGQVNKSTHYLSVPNRRGGSPSISKTSSTDKIKCVLLLTNQVPTLSISNLKTQKVAKITQIFYLKLLLQVLLLKKNRISIIIKDHHIIHIEQE